MLTRNIQDMRSIVRKVLKTKESESVSLVSCLQLTFQVKSQDRLILVKRITEALELQSFESKVSFVFEKESVSRVFYKRINSKLVKLYTSSLSIYLYDKKRSVEKQKVFALRKELESERLRMRLNARAYNEARIQLAEERQALEVQKLIHELKVKKDKLVRKQKRASK